MSNQSVPGWAGQPHGTWASPADIAMGLHLAEAQGGGGAPPRPPDPRREARRRRRRRLLLILGSLAVAVVFITVPTEANPVFYIVAFGALAIAVVESVRAVVSRLHWRASPGP
jgi:hypothetical protein